MPEARRIGEAQITGLGQTIVLWKETEFRGSCCANYLFKALRGKWFDRPERNIEANVSSWTVYLSTYGRNVHHLSSDQVSTRWRKRSNFSPFLETGLCLIAFWGVYVGVDSSQVILLSKELQKHIQ